MIERDTLAKMKSARYAGWDGEFGQQVLTGNFTLEALAAEAAKRDLQPKHVSGQQEALENLVNRYVYG
jgi:xylose isomerase